MTVLVRYALRGAVAIALVAQLVAIWQIDSPHFAGGVLPEVLATLQRDYTLVHRSPPGGLAHLWRRK